MISNTLTRVSSIDSLKVIVSSVKLYPTVKLKDELYTLSNMKYHKDEWIFFKEDNNSISRMTKMSEFYPLVKEFYISGVVDIEIIVKLFINNSKEINLNISDSVPYTKYKEEINTIDILAFVHDAIFDKSEEYKKDTEISFGNKE